MSSQGFSFPPPPPPPPPAAAQQPPYNSASHGQQSGRWASRGGGARGGRGRGHGNRRGRGGQDGSRPSAYPSNPAGFNNHSPVNYGYPPQPQPTLYMPYPQSQSPSYQPPQNPSPYATGAPPQSSSQHSYHIYNTSSHPQPTASYPQQPAPGYSSGAPTSTSPMQWGVDMQSGYMPTQQAWQARSHGTSDRKPQPHHHHKRDHSAAFGKPQSTAPRTPAPPPVPSFGNPLPSKPPAVVDATRKLPKKRKRKHNQLGLTPKTDEHESSEEDDVDEESKLAASDAAPLQFTYKGRTSTLQSATDIAAWIAERRKNFPTQTRVEEKKKVAEEAKSIREAAREAARQKTKPAADPVDEAMRAQQKAEKLRRNLDREQKRFAKAEAQAEAARRRVEALTKATETGMNPEVAVSEHNVGSPVDAHDATQEPHDLSGLSDDDSDDWTSSSGSSNSSESDSDSAPEEVSARRHQPERVPPPPRDGHKKPTVCRYFGRHGRCNRGDQCKFSHEVAERGGKTKTPTETKGRKGLFQALLERQREDENRLVMEVIMQLGQGGLLEADPETPSNS
ncbi:hypothetical protein N7510_005831 [Penicillium lagena]|uniref:uncharacterized protein n=1 Tax=Penicillium lagena TaxID=94218 RepID=UPI002540C8F3|nr:uncharacterized protein N7510_005831 [Penicillium lagena]KAJ5612637.1 hypothetical protein N7510_005831 [Penicillium lagena]